MKTSTEDAEALVLVVAAVADVDSDSTICVSHDVDSCDSSAETTAVSIKGRKTPMTLESRRNIMVDQRQP